MKSVHAGAVLLGVAALALVAGRADAGDLSGDVDAGQACREVLLQGAAVAVDRLGAVDGFLGNPEVKILLPRKLRKNEHFLRMAGLGDDIDEVVVAMNRAAEAAVPGARALLVAAVQELSLDDVRGMLAGGDDAVTRHFESVARAALADGFLPVVKAETDKLGLAADFNKVAGAAAQLGWIGADEANLEQYVTRKALDGVFHMMAAEERAIRQDPAGQASEFIRRVLDSSQP